MKDFASVMEGIEDSFLAFKCVLFGSPVLVTYFHLYPSCSIGNFFFAGARIFFQSLDAAIFLFSRVSEIPCDSLVLPVISTNDRLTLGCELQV